MADVLAGLNDEQLTAATHSEGYLRVIAGAGSGKTRMLVSRYAYLVQAMGIDPASILCVTFTNKAAAEMKTRIRALIGEGYDTSLICTYHGFCVRMLREDIERLFWPQNFRIIDATDQKNILRDIYEEMELKLDAATFEKQLKAISAYKAKYPYVQRMISREDDFAKIEVAGRDGEIVRRYLRRQKKQFAMDFDDLILFGLHLLSVHEDVRRKWQQRLNYIQVDEFQDSSAREMRLVDVLSGGYGNLMVVGDPDQNIYEWRGSDVALLVDFDKSHRPCTTATMSLNYRSTEPILTCANTLIRHNRMRVEKNLRTAFPGQPAARPVHFHGANDEAEAAWIAKRIRKEAKAGRPLKDFAVLYRAGHMSRPVENALVTAGIPYTILGGVRFYKRMEILDTEAYLKLIAGADDGAFKRIVNKPQRKMGRVRIARLEEQTPAGVPLLDSLRRQVDAPAFAGSGARAFLELIDGLREFAKTVKVPELVEEVLRRSGYETYIRELGDMERFDNLAEFKRVAREFVERYGEDVPLSTFLDHLKLQTDDEFAQDDDKVRMMTIHASKGMEFPVVFVVGMCEGAFPSSRSIEERKVLGLEEERRLAYVAITRAQQELYLTDSGGQSAQGMRKLPSRFLTEIGEENYDRIGTVSKRTQEEARAYIARHTPLPVATSASVRVGAQVEHPVFGSGVVQRVDAGRRMAVVSFPKLGQDRALSLDFVERLAKGEGAAVALPAVPAAAVPEAKPALPPVAAGPEAEPVLQPIALLPVREEKPQVEAEKAPAPAPARNLEAAPAPEPIDAPEGAFTIRIPQQPEAAPKPRVSLPNKFRYTNLTDDPNETNLWKRSDVPHDGWQCVGVTDLGKGNRTTCQMCGKQQIRYVHHMRHPLYPRTLNVGCVCAGWMEGNPEAAAEREKMLQAKKRRY